MEQYNMNIHVGETFHKSILIKDSAGTAIDITGWTPKMEIRAYPDADILVQSVACSIPTGTDGQIDLLISAANTAALEPGTYTYDLFTKDAGGISTCWIGGVFTIFPSVTEQIA